MSELDDFIARLRTELAECAQGARAVPAANLGGALLKRFSDRGPLVPAARNDLDEAISLLDETWRALAADDPLRPRVAFHLGFALSSRAGYFNDPEDRDRSAEVLGAAIASGRLEPASESVARVIVGYVQLTVSMEPMLAFATGKGMPDPSAFAAHRPDLGPVVAHFRAVLDGQLVSDDIREVASTGLELAEACRELFGGGAAGPSLQGLSDAMNTLMRAQQRAARNQQPGYGTFQFSSVFDPGKFGEVLELDLPDRPIAVVEEGPRPEVRPAEPEPASATAEPVATSPRRDLHELLSLTGSGRPVWEAAAALLRPETAPPAVAVVDEAVALASTVIDGEADATATEEAAVDWFLLAVSLYLRDRVDAESDGADRRAATEALLTAARRAPADHSVAPAILLSLGAFLGLGEPFAGLAAGFAGRLDAVLGGGAVTDQEEYTALHALRCVCRATWAVEEAAQAVERVAPDYPWRKTLTSTVR